MTFRRSPRIIFIVTLILLLLAVGSASGQDLVLKVGNVLAPANHSEIPLPIYMENQIDTVAGFEIWLVMSRPDIAKFYTVYDTIDYFVVAVDTTGTLISGWQYIEARSLEGLGQDANIVGIANLGPPPYNGGIPPQAGDTPLVKILFDTYEIFYPEEEYIVEIALYLDNFGFSNPQGDIIGAIYDTVVDTTCYNCVVWYDDTICFLWEEIEETTGDSCVVDTILFGHLDSNIVQIINGSIEVFVCGDVTGDDLFNIFDVVELIRCLYGGIPEPPPDCPEHIVDVNMDNLVNIFDITYMINNLYKGGPDPMCDYLWLD